MYMPMVVGTVPELVIFPAAITLLHIKHVSEFVFNVSSTDMVIWRWCHSLESHMIDCSSLGSFLGSLGTKRVIYPLHHGSFYDVCVCNRINSDIDSKTCALWLNSLFTEINFNLLPNLVNWSIQMYLYQTELEVYQTGLEVNKRN